MRRRSLEVYFILYLAALMLLMTDSPKRETDLASTALRDLVASTFSLIVEKPTLLCRTVIEGDTSWIVHFDSTNTIIPTGLVDSLHYRIVAEDQNSAQRVTLAVGDTTLIGSIGFVSEQIGQALRIGWFFSAIEPGAKLYRIRIEATARPQVPPNLSTHQQKQIQSLLATNETVLEAETSFLVGYLPRQSARVPSPVMPPDSAVTARLEALVTQQRTSTPDYGTFALVPEHSTINTIPYVSWENRIAIYGALPQRDLARPPQVSGISSAFVTIEGTTIVIRSVSTQASNANVRITLTRRDGAEASATFAVIVHTIIPPAAPSVMYPGIEYKLIPNLTSLTGLETRAVLRDDRNTIRASSSGQPLTFTPTLSDTGRTFFFERYAGSERIGQVLLIPCEMFPPPEITSIRRESERQYLIVCRAYGLESDQRTRARLELDPPGSGTVQELYGDYSYDERAHVRIQQFRVTIIGSPGLRLYAINGYQQRSLPSNLSLR
ncbi:MAG: hypothetical protein N2663_00395 [Chlorobi bacterium]|nr:hypothetical protein [Chlorobiota bacterium]